MAHGPTPPRPSDHDVVGDFRDQGRWVAELISSVDNSETCLAHGRIQSGGSVWAPVQVALAQRSQNFIREMLHPYNTHTTDKAGNTKASVLAEFKMI